ncbi:MAG: insulinase family protein [Saprospiraceae bacterium]|nr:insulinase family protein [Saprospiraceae bacterium]
MLNRQIAPEIVRIRTIDIPPIETINLDNGVPVVIINAGTEDIVKIEIVHKAGKSMEDKKLVSRATASLMKEGCGPWNAETFAEKFDFYGAGMKISANMDFIYTSVYTLGKYIPHIIEPLSLMYFSPHFETSELESFSNVNIQKLKEELTKNEVLSYRMITESIFGNQHPYGYNSFEEDYLAITIDDVKNHFNHYIGSDNMNIFLSGKISPEIIRLVNQYFGQHKKQTIQKPVPVCSLPLRHERWFEKAPGDIQASLKIGRHLFDRTHPDQTSFFVLNTIFGGYFSSRLMSVIREDKGYTYDIGSQMDQMLHDGCFYVSTELSAENIEETIREIYVQMEKLCSKKVGTKELDMVKNYLSGNFLHMVDGPLQIAVVAKTLALTGLPFSSLTQWIQDVMDTSANDVLACAQKYLDPKEMIEVVVA